MSDTQPDPYIDAMAAEHVQEYEPAGSSPVRAAYPPRCDDPDCDGDLGHDGPHFAWVPE